MANLMHFNSEFNHESLQAMLDSISIPKFIHKKQPSIASKYHKSLPHSKWILYYPNLKRGKKSTICNQPSTTTNSIISGTIKVTCAMKISNINLLRKLDHKIL
uniref:Uncharacterized protein n=1 Tax=Opuntia streptacantha TaxID=393608 RepID=A0A7C8Z6I9_OPUST